MSRLKVLIIDDEEFVRQIYCEFIAASGVDLEIDLAPSFEHAEDLYGEKVWDIVFCDHHTHGINSHTIWRTLKGQGRQPSQFWIVTGNEDIQALPDMSGIIYKPNYDALMAVVGRRQFTHMQVRPEYAA